MIVIAFRRDRQDLARGVKNVFRDFQPFSFFPCPSCVPLVSKQPGHWSLGDRGGIGKAYNTLMAVDMEGRDDQEDKEQLSQDVLVQLHEVEGGAGQPEGGQDSGEQEVVGEEVEYEDTPVYSDEEETAALLVNALLRNSREPINVKETGAEESRAVEQDMIVNENKKNEERDANVEPSTANGRLVLVAQKERDEINPRQSVMLEANLFSKMGSGLYCLLVILSLFQQDFVICIFL